MNNGVLSQGTDGFFLSLLTESFAVRALIGSLAAAALAALAVRLGLARSASARRILVLGPVLTAAVAAVASLRDAEAYLPQLWLTSAAQGPAGQVLDLLGDVRVIATDRGVDMLVVAYSGVALVLLLRRAAGFARARRLIRRGVAADVDRRNAPLLDTVQRLALRLRIAAPRVLLLTDCPGGAFTTGVRRPTMAIDPRLLHRLDERELEGLVAHELAHIRRRDTALRTLVGTFRDLTFFLPPIHLAARWLHSEQEESADEVATRHTGRPFALASSILKVYDARAAGSPGAACTAVPARPRLAVLTSGAGRAGLAFPHGTGLGTAPVDAQRLSGAARAVAHRVERLLTGTPSVSRVRKRAEVAVAVAVISVAVGAALAVPTWVARDLEAGWVSFAVLGTTASFTEESPAFATFRALAAADAPITDAALRPSQAGPTRGLTGACPCVETPAQLRGQAEVPMEPYRMLWRGPGQDPWEVTNLQDRAAMRARPLWTFSESGPQVGVFVGRGPS